MAQRWSNRPSLESETALGMPTGHGMVWKDESGPTIFDAMAQPSLKLESRKGSVSTIVIEHEEKSCAGESFWSRALGIPPSIRMQRLFDDANAPA
jgi:hypothetical protein